MDLVWLCALSLHRVPPPPTLMASPFGTSLLENRHPTPVLFLTSFHAFCPPGSPVQSRFIINRLHEEWGSRRKGALLRINTEGVSKVHRNSVGKHSEVLASDVEVNVPAPAIALLRELLRESWSQSGHADQERDSEKC